ncbi:MAG TPA: sortase [Aggregatilineales bacterium]|nr:sortase [Anaerolineales bacterium]HRE46268.1 sortase [Aggregatilineales bacterium]
MGRIGGSGKLWRGVVMIGIALFTLGAGMRVYAQITLGQTIQRLLDARPPSPIALTAPSSQPLALAPSAPSSLRLPEYDLWNVLTPVTVTYDAANTPLWETADSAWHVPSGIPGQAGSGFGNVVLGGHTPASDPEVWARSVFRALPTLNRGDQIVVEAGTARYSYQVALVFAIPAGEANNPEAAAWLAPTGDERLTLITCFPPHTAAYRVIAVAFPTTFTNTGDLR